jgi:hypothetical protein
MSDQILTRIVKNMLTLFLLCFSVTALAQTIVVNGDPSDWPKVINKTPPVSVAEVSFIHDATNMNDDQFTQGSQDDNVLSTKWHWNRGSTNDKGDIQNACAALVNDTLYFFGDRTAINGTAQIGFWFFLDDVFPKPDGTFNGEHRVGDLLVLSNFVNGGGTVQIKVYQFTGYGGGKAQFKLLTSGGDTARAAVNNQEYNVPSGVTNWTFQAKGGVAGKYVTGSYFEGFIALKKITSNLCFQQFLMETRNSAELSASQQDMAADDFDILPDVNLTVALKAGVTKGTAQAGCPDLYQVNANTALFAGLKATGGATYTWDIKRSDGSAVGSEITFTVGNPADSATFTINNLDATQYIYRIIVTGSKGTGCDDKDTVCIQPTGSLPNCGVSGPSPVCPRTLNWYFYDPDKDGKANSIPAGFIPTWSVTGDGTAGTISAGKDSIRVTAGAECNKTYTVRLELASTSGFGNTSCDTTVSINVKEELKITCPENKTVSCGSPYDPATTGKATVTDPTKGCGTRVYYKDVVTRTWYATDSCGNTVQCTQTIRTSDSCVVTASSAARMITSADAVPATQGVTSPVKAGPATKDLPVLTRTTNSVNTANKGLQIQAFPNPFSKTINFRFVSQVSGHAVLEVFNTQGQRVGIAFDGNVNAGATKSVQFSTGLSNQALIYKLKIGDKTVRGTVLELKR